MSEEQEMREAYEAHGDLVDSTDSSNYDSEFGCGRFVYIFLAIAVVFILFSAWRYYGLIGSFGGSTGSLNIHNEANVDLDIEAIEASAQKLRQNFDLDISIFIFESMEVTPDGSTNYSYSTFVAQRNFSEIPPNSLVIVIGIDDQYSELTWGANLGRLQDSGIRGEVMNPRLFEGDYTGAISRTFDASLERLSDGDLAMQELMRGYGQFIDEVFILGIVLVVILVVWQLQSQGILTASGSSSGSSWYSSDTSSSSSSWSWGGGDSGGSSDSGSSGDSGGGSDSGSWSD